MKEWETNKRSVCVCSSALTRASTYDLQMRVTSRAPQQNNRGRQRRKKKQKKTLPLPSATHDPSVCVESAQQRWASNADTWGRGGWNRERMSMKEGQQETESGSEHETEQMAGENKRHQDSQGSIWCWVRMERDVTEGEKWQQWSQLHHWCDGRTHPDSSASLSSSASPAEDGSSSTYGCLHAASSVYYRYRGVCIFLYITALCHCSRSGLIKITFSKKQLQQQRTRPETMEKPTENML